MSGKQLQLFTEEEATSVLTTTQLHQEIIDFKQFGKKTTVLEYPGPCCRLPVYVNEFWTAKQRAAHSLHEVSYRACFKPQLPRFFITRLTKKGDIVYDPFMGRGTTILEAALLNRIPYGCDINPLSRIIAEPRLDPPEIEAIRRRMETIDLEKSRQIWEELLVFYHPATLLAITNLREYLLEKEANGNLDRIDAWIRMVATNRLTGHSRGFFSVYTLPPNQAVSIESQEKINRKRGQTPPLRDIRNIILKKSHSLLSKLNVVERHALKAVSGTKKIITGSSDSTPQLEENSVQLVVTSPPFLDIVDYQRDNWLRCWFNGINAQDVRIWQLPNPEEWENKMTGVFRELKRLLKRGGHVAFEVGEVRKGKVLLENHVVPAAIKAGLTPEMILVNSQVFTKTSNCWGIDNQTKGTNTNRIILLKKD